VRRAGILGYGYMGRTRHAALQQRSDCEVVRIVEDERLDFREVAEDPGLDCIFVCLPNYLTCEAVCRALEAGKDVFAEKPPGICVAEVRRMIEAESRSGKTLKFGFNHRYHPAVRAAERRIQSGDLGELLWLRGRYGKPLAPDFPGQWRADKAQAGGGILMDQGIHMLDLMRAWSGGFDQVAAFATASFSRKLEDDLVAILRNRAGQLASLHSSHTQWTPLFSLEVGLSLGAITLQGLLSRSGRYGPEQLCWRTRSDASERVETFTGDDSWELELDEFFAAASGAAPVRVGSTAEALPLMILVESIYAAAETGRWTSSSNS
jgi:1,5-anhydro-D-fructose reductase (1,5-anhydro-D-mannitol-forming)